MSALEQFDAAVTHVTQDRTKVYGHPADDFARIDMMAEGIKDCHEPRVRHALYMILVKVARLVQTPNHVDSMIDIAGYARTIAMIIDRQ